MAELPECVKRWRKRHPDNRRHIWKQLDRDARDSLEWLATTPEPEVHAVMGVPHPSCRHCNTPLPDESAIVAAASGDVEVPYGHPHSVHIRKLERLLHSPICSRGGWPCSCRDVAIINRAQLMALARRLENDHESASRIKGNARYDVESLAAAARELRALLKAPDE